MPTRPLSACTEPGCPRLVSRAGPCAQHASERAKTRRAHETWRNYGRAWKDARRLALGASPLCPCGELAVDVDHIVPLRDGGTHELTNLQSLCRSCHSKKTARENGFGGSHGA